MIELRPFSKLGSADHGWLKAKHHFSFGSHYDPANMGHGALRVWNDDEIAPNTGFPAHPHANMEIITYVREGAITHQDSLGNKGRTEAGDVQVMSAGSGIRHSEYNLEPQTPRSSRSGSSRPRRAARRPGAPSRFRKSDRSGNFVTIASGIRRRQGRAADPCRRAGARRHAEGRRERGICARQNPQPLSGAGGGRGRDQRRPRQRPRRRRRSATRHGSRSRRWKIPNWCWSTRREPASAAT